MCIVNKVENVMVAYSCNSFYLLPKLWKKIQPYILFHDEDLLDCNSGANEKEQFFAKVAMDNDNIQSSLDKIAKEFKFPYYYSNNLDSFDECIKDINEWLELDNEKEYILSIDNIMSNINNIEINVFLNILCSIVCYWLDPKSFGGESDTRKFYILLRINSISESMRLFELLIQQGEEVRKEFEELDKD